MEREEVIVLSNKQPPAQFQTGLPELLNFKERKVLKGHIFPLKPLF